MKKHKNNYINNKEFLRVMIEYRTAVRNAIADGEPKPRIPEYIGECFLRIAENLSHKPNFLSYTFRDEMVNDAIENCCMYVDNFNPNKSKNPFAYFTQITYYAFLRRIQREKKHLYVKYKQSEIAAILDENEQMVDGDGNTRQFEMYDNIAEFIQNFEDAKAKKKRKQKIGLEKYMPEPETSN